MSEDLQNSIKFEILLIILGSAGVVCGEMLLWKTANFVGIGMLLAGIAGVGYSKHKQKVGGQNDK